MTCLSPHWRFSNFTVSGAGRAMVGFIRTNIYVICGRLPAEIVGSNPTGGMDVCDCWVLSGRGLCNELITRPEESYGLWCVVVRDLETSRMRRPWTALGRSATAKNKTWSVLYNVRLRERKQLGGICAAFTHLPQGQDRPLINWLIQANLFGIVYKY